MTPDLLRETLREVLYGPNPSFGLGTGLFREKEAGLLRTVHGFSYAQAAAPAAPDRPSPAQVVVHLRQYLEHAAAELQDPLTLRPDEPEAWDMQVTATAWRDELVRLARAGQALYDALYLPLNAEQTRLAHAAILHAAYHTGALRFHLGNLQASR